MTKKSYWLSISAFVLMLIWTIYYYAMRYTGGFADLKDTIICGVVGLICVIFIVKRTINFLKRKKSANCKCKLDTCTVEQSESERWSGWRPLASILGDAAAAFGCVNRVEELVKQFLRGTVAQFLARPSI